MMRSEFIERTKYEPTMDEYNIIEQSYYEFDGNKDEFCKEWLKNKKNGKWDMELKFRKNITELQEARLAEKESFNETIIEYQNLFVEYMNQIRDLNNELEALKTENERLNTELALATTEITIVKKDGEETACRCAEVEYIDHNGFRFVKVTELNGWTTSYKLDDIESITVR